MTNEATIIRVASRRDNPYVLITREAMQDEQLTFEARGVLAYLLSKPDDWQLRVTDLQRSGNMGKNRTYRIINELLEVGYMQRRDQHKNEDGTWSASCYFVFETPQTPCPRNPHTENGDTYILKEDNILKRTPPKQTLARKLSEITKHKKEWSEQLKEWHTLDTTALQKEVGMWQGYKRKYPRNKYADKCLDYLSKL